VPEPSARTTLTTERLVLRQLREADLDALAEIYADPETMRFLGGPRTRESTRTRLVSMIAEHREQGFGLWATTLRADGTLIGRCGILVQEVEGRIEHEIAYLLGREWWGKGYATEAAAAIRGHARAELGLARLISLIDPENAASQAVARRIGMQHERTVVFEGRATMLFAEKLVPDPVFSAGWPSEPDRRTGA
jgi:ribosomal-protein-alanine N-acetyltransferase